MKRIAILGATGQIGRGLTERLLKENVLHLFSRTPKKLISIEDTPNTIDNLRESSYSELLKHEYDVIINAAAPGDPTDIKNSGYDLFKSTENIDNLAIDYLQENPDTKYIYLSSGAIYANNYQQQSDSRSTLSIPVNQLDTKNFSYPIIKINAEAKHRALNELSIVDIRIFGYVSKYINMNGGFFLSQLFKAAHQNFIFNTTEENFTRDYISEVELADLVSLIMSGPSQNTAVDMYSKEIVTKQLLLKHFTQKYALKTNVDINEMGSTDSSSSSFSLISALPTLKTMGYKPSQSSLEIIDRVFQELNNA